MFYKTALLTLLGAFAAAAPTSSSTPLLQQRADACSVATAPGYCTTLTWNDRSTSSSPTSAQCVDTCRRVIGDAGDWGVDFKGRPAGYKDIMEAGDCQFAISRASDTDTSEFSFSMDNADITDAIGGAISRFAGSHGGRVKADGTMNCSGHTVKWYVG